MKNTDKEVTMAPEKENTDEITEVITHEDFLNALKDAGEDPSDEDTSDEEPTEEDLEEEHLRRARERRREMLRRRNPEALLCEWAEETDFETFASEIEKRVVGQRELRVLLMEVYLYIQNIAHERPAKCNVILTAPSGCGKTETYRALKDYFRSRVPGLVIHRADLANVTSTGFRGKDPITILEPLKHSRIDGAGIIFMDEFDKKLMPEYSNRGENVNLAVQNQLLCMVEGMEQDGIDTENVMFIGCGSFQAVRDARKDAPRELGFGAKQESETEKHFSPVTRAEILEMGACPELIGRFGPVINYEPLNQEALERILEQIRTRQKQFFRREVFLGEGFKAELRAQMNSPFGVRLWESMVHEEVLRALLLGGTASEDKAVLIKGGGEYEFFTVLREEEGRKLEESLEREPLENAS